MCTRRMPTQEELASMMAELDATYERERPSAAPATETAPVKRDEDQREAA
ncbi:MAG: hypothetical protein AAGE52_15835 [Myxococcota bacterium]